LDAGTKRNDYRKNIGRCGQSYTSDKSKWHHRRICSGTAELAARADHTHPLTSREIVCADNISVAAIDSGGNVAVPIPIILVNATAITEQLPAGTYSLHTAIQRLMNNVASLFSTKANLASPTLTGTPTAPTATAGTNTTQIATTVFVVSALAGKANTDYTHADLPVSLHSHAATDITNLQTLLNGKQNTLNRTIGGNDDATGTITDTSNDLSIPVPVTVAAPSASTTQITAGTRSLFARMD